MRRNSRFHLLVVLLLVGALTQGCASLSPPARPAVGSSTVEASQAKPVRLMGSQDSNRERPAVDEWDSEVLS